MIGEMVSWGSIIMECYTLSDMIECYYWDIPSLRVGRPYTERNILQNLDAI